MLPPEVPPEVPLLVPLQVPPSVALDRVTLAGSVSTRALLSVASVLLVLPSVIVSVLVPPGAIRSGLNAFVTVGRLLTDKFAVFDPVPAVGVSVEVTPLAVFG